MHFSADFPVEKLTSATERHKWVVEKVQYAQDNFLDGINVDFESAVEDPQKKQGLTALIQELASAFRKQFKKPQVFWNFQDHVGIFD